MWERNKSAKNKTLRVLRVKTILKRFDKRKRVKAILKRFDKRKILKKKEKKFQRNKRREKKSLRKLPVFISYLYFSVLSDILKYIAIV